MSSTPRPVPDSVLTDLRDRLRATRRVALPEGVGWSRGTDADYLAELVDYWAETYYWREHEERLLGYPWARTESGLRAIHQRADADAPTVVLLHGWPDSFLRFERVLPLLTDVNVVVPALPGFPYADPLTDHRHVDLDHGRRRRHGLAELGYHRYVVSGGDIGSSVGESLAAAHPDRVAALHLTDIPYTHLFTVDPGELTDAGAGLPGRGAAVAVRRGRVRPGTGDQAAHARGRRSATRRPGWRPGSSRSCAAGATAAATSRRCSRATTC